MLEDLAKLLWLVFHRDFKSILISNSTLIRFNLTTANRKSTNLFRYRDNILLILLGTHYAIEKKF